MIAKAAKSALRDAEGAVTRDAVARGEQRTAKQVLTDMETKLVDHLSEDQGNEIAALAKKAERAEKIITPKLEKIAAETPGTELAGLQYARKSLDSLRRKVATDVFRDGKLFGESLSGINDAVRYTFKSSREEYARVTEDVARKLQEAGFERVKVKNFWRSDEGYQGINSIWRHAETGQNIEVQFHTFESLEAKEGTHGIYDFQRLPNLGGDLEGYLGGLQNRIFGMVTKPPGAAGINW